MKQVHFLPSDLVDAMPARLWATGNLFWLFDEDVHFCSNGARTIELDGDEIGSGNASFLSYPDDVVDEPVTRAAAEAFLEFVAMVASRQSREVKFTPQSADTATWQTRDPGTDSWVDDSMVDVGTGASIAFKIVAT
jgi:hypothetical protein